MDHNSNLIVDSHTWDMQPGSEQYRVSLSPILHKTTLAVGKVGPTESDLHERAIPKSKVSKTKQKNKFEQPDQQLISISGKAKRKGRGRRGQLNPDRAQKAKEMRHLKACLLCWVNKVPVSILILTLFRSLTEYSAALERCVRGAEN